MKVVTHLFAQLAGEQGRDRAQQRLCESITFSHALQNVFLFKLLLPSRHNKAAIDVRPFIHSQKVVPI